MWIFRLAAEDSSDPRAGQRAHKAAEVLAGGQVGTGAEARSNWTRPPAPVSIHVGLLLLVPLHLHYDPHAMVDPSDKQLSTAARQRLDAARQVIDIAQAPKPQDACYLVHVAIECALKWRILQLYPGARRISQLKPLLGDDLYQQLFASKEGHNLSLLIEKSAVKRLLQAKRQEVLLAGPVWSKMCGRDRPYSLRYGTETVSRSAANDSLTLGNELIGLVLEG